MKLMNPKKPVMASWLQELGHRLDAPPFLSGAIEAKKILANLKARKDSLQALTQGGMPGIIHAGRIPRIWAEDREHGVPFLSSTDILQADLSTLSFISNRAVASNPKLIIHSGWTLITRSGTIGRTAFARPEMDGMACTEDVLRVNPNKDAVLGGYLYAFLSSRFGVPLLTSGTYGAIIQHIEPEHIANLPVPRFSQRLEESVDSLIQAAADLRSEASMLVNLGIERLIELARLPALHRIKAAYPFGSSFVPSSKIRVRFDAFYHSPFHSMARSAIETSGASMRVSEIAHTVVEPIRFKRIHTEDAKHGIPFFGSSAIMNSTPEPSYMLVRSNPLVQQCIVGEATVLVPRSGQVSGIIGSAILPFGDLIGGAVTEDAIRINCDSEIDAGFVFLALSSEYGRRQLKARTFGSSIPHLDVRSIEAVLLPKLRPADRSEVGAMGHKSAQLRDQAIKKERAARALVESSIEENA